MKEFFPHHYSRMIAESVTDEQQSEEIRANQMLHFGRQGKVGLSWTEVNGELVVNELVLS
jgi:hypothetical protein